jgi:hypothetical protein
VGNAVRQGGVEGGPVHARLPAAANLTDHGPAV